MKKALSIMAMLAVCFAFVFLLPTTRMSAQAAKQTTNKKADIVLDEPGPKVPVDPIDPLDPTDSVLTLNKYSATYGPETFSGSFKIYASIGWTISANASWFHLNKTSGSGNATIQITLDPNFTGSTRTGVIKVSAKGYNGIFKEFKLTQTSLPSKLTLSKSSENIDYWGGRVDITVTSPSSWTVKNDYNRPWAHIETSSGLAGKTTIKILIDRNNTSSYRCCPLTFRANNGTSAYFVINQSPYTEPAPNIEIGFPGQNGQIEEKTVYSNLTATGTEEHLVEFDCNKLCYIDSIQIIHFTFQTTYHIADSTQFLEVENPIHHYGGDGNCASYTDHTIKCYAKYSGYLENGAWGVWPVLTIDTGYYTYKICFKNMQKKFGPVKWSIYKDYYRNADGTPYDPYKNGSSGNSGNGYNGFYDWATYKPSYWTCIRCLRQVPDSYYTCPCGGYKTWKCKCGVWNSHDSTQCCVCKRSRTSY